MSTKNLNGTSKEEFSIGLKTRKIDFRTNNGVTEFRNNGGAWIDLAATLAALGNVDAALNVVDNSIVRGDGGAYGVQDSGIIIDDSNNMSGVATESLSALQFLTSYVPGAQPEGHVSWASVDYTMEIASGLGPILQVGQELWIIVYNPSTTETLSDATPVYPTGGFGGRPSVSPAKADSHETIAGKVVVTTMAIPPESFGICTEFGKIRNIDTTMYDLGNTLWVSATDAGELTADRPEFPNYPIQVGGVTNKHATEGEIVVGVEGDVNDTVLNFWNGTIRETFDFRISSDGATITGYLTPSNGHPNLTMLFSDGPATLIATPAAEITLLPGSASLLQHNYVYITKTNKYLEVSSSGWPTDDEFIKIGDCQLLTAALTHTDGAIRNQNINDHLADTNTFQGHLSHITERLRLLFSPWEDGVAQSVNEVGGGLAVYLSNTAGHVYQMHRHEFPMFDMTPHSIIAVSTGSKTFTFASDLTLVYPIGRIIQVNSSTGNDGLYTVVSVIYSSPNTTVTVEEVIPDATVDGYVADDVHVVNHSTAPYTTYDDLTIIPDDASGDPLINTSFKTVTFGVANKTGEVSHIMMNVPTGTYNKNFPDQAYADIDKKTVYTIPKEFQGVGFLIAAHTWVNNAGQWNLQYTENLLGFVPNTSAGGGGVTGGGVTTLLELTDAPSSYSGAGGYTLKVNAGATGIEFVDEGSTGEANTIVDIGSGTGIAGGKTGVALQLKSFVSSGGTVSFSASGTEINVETVHAAGDYSASEVTNDSSVAGSNVDDALEQLDTDIALKLPLAGGEMTGDIDMDGNDLIDVEGMVINGSVVCPFHQIDYAASITPDFADGTDQYVILTGDVTINAPSNATAGARMVLYIYQDGTGSHTATLNAVYDTAGGSGLSLTADGNAKDIISLLVDKDGGVDLVVQGDSK